MLPADVPPGAGEQTATRTTADGRQAHSLRTLLDHRAARTLNRIINRIALAGYPDPPVTAAAADPTPTRQRAVELPGIDPARMFPVNIRAD